MPTELRDAAVEAAKLVLEMGSHVVEFGSLLAEFGGVPGVGGALKMLTAFRRSVEAVQSNRKELRALEQRCTYMTACVIVKLRQSTISPSSGPDVTPLAKCVEAAGKFAERCTQRNWAWKWLKANSDKDELKELNESLDRLRGDLGLAEIATVFGEVTDLKGMLVRLLWHVLQQREG